jgi:hypothetical protein
MVIKWSPVLACCYCSRECGSAILGGHGWHTHACAGRTRESRRVGMRGLRPSDFTSRQLRAARISPRDAARTSVAARMPSWTDRARAAADPAVDRLCELRPSTPELRLAYTPGTIGGSGFLARLNVWIRALRNDQVSKSVGRAPGIAVPPERALVRRKRKGPKGALRWVFDSDWQRNGSIVLSRLQFGPATSERCDRQTYFAERVEHVEVQITSRTMRYHWPSRSGLRGKSQLYFSASRR